jgi:Bax protein|tara:strand:- start:938 stop:1603 length:666 start_codon:yes stop_codon:yes gene_type:complete
MPSKHQWEKWVHKAWFYTKVLFAVMALMTATYYWGTYNPNKNAIAQVNEELDIFYMNKIEEMDLQEPEFTYINDTQFIRAMHKCINYINFKTPKNLRVPYEMIIGQAALESGWGTSRFAKEANNLFGIRTWTKETPHLLPVGIEQWPGWGVRVFPSKCDSVKEYVRLLNEHPAYEDFRELRLKTNDPIALIKTLDKFSTTKDYDVRVIRMIKKIRKLEESE